MSSSSSMSLQVDQVFFALLIFSGILLLAVFVAIGYFLIKYRASNSVNRENPLKHQRIFEITWFVGTLILFIPLFVWSAKVYYELYLPPFNSVEINVTAKRWMWKFYRAGGLDEINDLHLLINEPVRLVMKSEDVIHSFFVPAFRVKQDVLPGQYTSLWFTPTELGWFPLLCTQYCGTDHASMNGRVVVLSPAEYEAWKKSMKKENSP